ncbi:MAG: hypothetical protein V1874_03260 [Spirochaetota bacterium]
MKEQLNIWLEKDIIDKIKKLAADQSKKAGFTMTTTDVINEALKKFIADNLKKAKK